MAKYLYTRVTYMQYGTQVWSKNSLAIKLSHNMLEHNFKGSECHRAYMLGPIFGGRYGQLFSGGLTVSPL